MSKNQISIQATVMLLQARELIVQARTNLQSLEASPPPFFDDADFWTGTLEQQRRLLGRLEVLTAELARAELDRTLEAADDIEPLRVRNEAYDRLYEVVLDVKRHLESGLGSGSSARYGLSGTTRRKPAALVLLVRNAIGLMEEDPQQGSNQFGGEANTAAVVTALRPLVEALDAAIKVTSREDTEYQEALHHRDGTLTALYAATSFVLDTHTSLLALCDRDKMIRAARAIRKTPTSRSASEAPVVSEAPAEVSEEM